MKTLLQYQLRQAELKKIMAESDSYASKCYKIGASFSEMYPEKFAEYVVNNLGRATLANAMNIADKLDNPDYYTFTEFNDFVIRYSMLTLLYQNRHLVW